MPKAQGKFSHVVGSQLIRGGPLLAIMALDTCEELPHAHANCEQQRLPIFGVFRIVNGRAAVMMNGNYREPSALDAGELVVKLELTLSLCG
jgi:hypothetical protein